MWEQMNELFYQVEDFQKKSRDRHGTTLVNRIDSTPVVMALVANEVSQLVVRFSVMKV